MKKTVAAALCLILYIAACAGILWALASGGVRLLFVCVTFVSGGFLAWLLLWLRDTGRMNFSHILVAWLVVNGTCLLWGVMYLAVTGAENIAETLGRYVVTELLGTVGGSLAKSIVENLSKNNSWPDRAPAAETPRGEPARDL